MDQIEVRPNFQGSMARSSATVQVSLDGGRPAVNELIRKLTMLADLTPTADASVAELPRTYCSGDYSSTRSELESRSSEKDPPRVGVRGPLTSSFTEPHQMTTSATSISSGSQRRVVSWVRDLWLDLLWSIYLVMRDTSSLSYLRWRVRFVTWRRCVQM